MIRRKTILLALGLVWVGVCGLLAQLDKEKLEEPVSVKQINAWVNREWELVRLVYQGRTQPLPKDQTTTFRFMPSFRVMGNGPINRFWGGYRLRAGGQLTWSGLMGLTKKAGQPELMKLEKTLVNAMGKTERILLVGKTLVFRDHEKKMILEWKERGEDKAKAR